MEEIQRVIKLTNAVWLECKTTEGSTGGKGITDSMARALTSVNPSFSGLMGSLAEFPGKLIFFPSPKGLVGILCRYP